MTRFLEAWVVYIHCFILTTIPLAILGSFAFLYLLYHGWITRGIAIFYFIYFYLDRHAKDTPGRVLPRWVSALNEMYFNNLRSYFPITLEAQENIPPDQNYLVPLSPHGIVAFAQTCLFTSPQFRKIFGKNKNFFMAFNDITINVPGVREYSIYMNHACSVSEEPLVRNLLHPNTVVGIYPGKEAVSSRPGHHLVAIKKRKGFCRVALRSGAWILPSYAFGELEAIDTEDATGTWFEPVQKFLLTKLGFGIPKVKSCVRRVPITLVLGEPIEVRQISQPSKEEVEELHKKYLAALKNLFDSHKSRFEDAKDAELIIE